MTVEIRIAASVETVARWQLAADRASFPLHEWIVEYLDVASDPDAGQVVDVAARLRKVEAEADDLREVELELRARALGAEARVEALEAALRPFTFDPPLYPSAEDISAARAALAVSGNQP